MKKENVLKIYAALSFVMLFGQPDTPSLLLLTGYYAFVLVNLANAARLSRKIKPQEPCPRMTEN